MLASFFRLMRPGDWTKNVFVLPALVFSVASSGLSAEAVRPLLTPTLMAVAAFCLIASGFYAINDVVDREKDRLHPLKRTRPIASGRIPPSTALGFGAVLIALALGLAAMINTACLLTLVAYALLQILYNAGIKRVMVVDVCALASGFVLRAAAGAAAIEVKMSIWLILCVFFLCTFLALVKRLSDLASAERAGATDWKSPAGYDDRRELDWLLALFAIASLLTYLMYAVSPHARTLFGPRSMGFALLSPLIIITMHRFYHRAALGASDSPLRALREDRVVQVAALLFVVGIGATLFVPSIGAALERMFFLAPG